MLNFQRIYFDSEPFVANGWPSLSARMRRVLELARSLSVSVYLPHAVREELEARWGAELQRHIDALRNDANTIKRDLKVVGGSFELGAVPSHSQSLAIYRQTIDATVARWGLQLVDLTSRSATYVFRLALARKAPFHRETDAGFKDTIILLSVIEHLEHDPAPSVLVTRDDRFGEADVSFFTRETVALRVLPLEAVEHELEAALDAIQREAMEQDRQKAWKAITGAWSALSEFLRADPERLREALGIFSVVGQIVSVEPTILVEVKTPFPLERTVGEDVTVAADIEVDIEYVPTWYVEQPKEQATPYSPLFEARSAPIPHREAWALIVEASVPVVEDGYGQPKFISVREGSRKAFWSEFRRFMRGAAGIALDENQLAEAYRESVIRKQGG